MSERKIIHIDMDCFYAAVEVKYRPELKGKPIGIGGPANSRSVLCTASYEARKFGVRSAMPSSQAVKLCPQLILIPPNFDLYKKESRAVREIFQRFTEKVEPLSLDEAYLDVSGAPSASKVASEIRSMIFNERQLTASAGVAPNKFLAKVASDWRKPNGQYVIPPSRVADFVKDLKVEKIFGVGKVTAKKMHELGLQTCGDIQKVELRQLIKWFGSRGTDLRDLAHGIDHRPVESNSIRKSLTVEETFNKDLTSLNECLTQIRLLFESWERQMKKHKGQSRIRGIVVKAKYFDFKTTTHETSTHAWPTLSEFEVLLQNIWKRRSAPIRLLGLGVRLGTPKEEDTSQLVFQI